MKKKNISFDSDLVVCNPNTDHGLHVVRTHKIVAESPVVSNDVTTRYGGTSEMALTRNVCVAAVS